MLTVPVLATLTDRIDARKILIAGSAVSALGTLLFGLFATGLWSGALFNAIAGVGFAGAYMPGLKALTDRLAPGDSSRAITFYTSSFSFGVGLSFLVSQLVAEDWGWRSAFYVTALGPIDDADGLPAVAAGRTEARAGTLAGFRAGVPQHQGDGVRARLRRALLRALRHPDLAGRVLDLRHHPKRTTSILTPVVVSVVFSLLAMPASILGNELRAQVRPPSRHHGGDALLRRRGAC